MTDTSGGDQWSTPQWLFDHFNHQYAFTLDAAASDLNHKCKAYFTIEHDALHRPWDSQSVWCNPPYSQTARWIDKAIYEIASAKRPMTIVMLVPNDTSTLWFQRAWEHAQVVTFLVGRVKFGGLKGSPRFGNTILVFTTEQTGHTKNCNLLDIREMQYAADKKGPKDP